MKKSKSINLNRPEYEVGYRKPPVAYRFKPGQSGNPLGGQRARHRPVHMAQARLDYFEVAHALVTISIGGEKVTMPRIKALIHAEFDRAFKGSGPASKRMTDLYLAFSAAQEEQEARVVELALLAENNEAQEDPVSAPLDCN